jgi:hypothetical protein
METTTNNEQINELVPPRPQFLTVLCILTWICSGLIFISTIWKVIMPETPEKQLEKIEQLRQYNPEMADQMEALLEKQQEKGNSGMIFTNVLTLVALGFSAFGASMMWQLKRTGFFLYLAGEILPYAGFLFTGTDELNAAGAMSGMGDSFVGIVVGVMLLFDIIFIAMYATNLKYMTRK